MEKISSSWLIHKGFKKKVYNNTQSTYEGGVVSEKHVIYTIDFSDRWARFDSYYIVTTSRYGHKSISRFYTFSGTNYKTNFKVENDITHFLPTTEQIKSALNVIGIVI